MGSHRLKWGWWLVAAIAVAVAASLFLYRRSATPAGSSASVSAETEFSGPVVRDTVYVKVDGETVPVVRDGRSRQGIHARTRPLRGNLPALTRPLPLTHPLSPTRLRPPWKPSSPSP